MLRYINSINIKPIPVFRGNNNSNFRSADLPSDTFEKNEQILSPKLKEKLREYIKVCYDKDDKKVQEFLSNKQAMNRIYVLTSEDCHKKPIPGLSRALTITEAFDAVDLGLSDKEIEDTLWLETELWKLKQKDKNNPDDINLYFMETMFLRRFDGLNLKQCALVLLLEDIISEKDAVNLVKKIIKADNQTMQ